MIDISVIIPIYKVEKVLNRCVDSVLRQTYTDYEVILVDDGSPDRCGEICDAYEQEHEKVTVIHKENGGLSDARNAGLKKAHGNYVMFLDSDDYVTDDCLEVLRKNDADMIIGTTVFAFENKEDRHQPEREDGMVLPEDYAEELPALLDERRLNYVHAKLYRRSVITENDLSFEDDMLTSAEDTVFNFTFLKYCRSIYVSAKPVHFYVQNTTGLAQKFYPDRYQRFCRLNGYIEQVCRELDIYNEETARAVNTRRASSAVWTIDGILSPNSGLTRLEIIQYLDEIAEDPLLKSIIGTVDVRGSEDLVYLLSKGSKRFLQRKKRGEFVEKVKGKLSSIGS